MGGKAGGIGDRSCSYPSGAGGPATKGPASGNRSRSAGGGRANVAGGWLPNQTDPSLHKAAGVSHPVGAPKVPTHHGDATRTLGDRTPRQLFRAPGERNHAIEQWAEGDLADRALVPRVTGGKRPRIDGRKVPPPPGRLDIEHIPRPPGETQRQAVARVRTVIGTRISDHPPLMKAWSQARAAVLQNNILTPGNKGKLYDKARNLFWTRVRQDPAARKILTDAGFVLTGEASTAAKLQTSATPGSTARSIPVQEVTVSLDHIQEKGQGDNWKVALDGDNLRFEFCQPNTTREVTQQRHPELRSHTSVQGNPIRELAKSPNKLPSTDLKSRIGSNIRAVIKSGKTQSAAIARGALQTLQTLRLENVPGRSYVKRNSPVAAAAVKPVAAAAVKPAAVAVVAEPATPPVAGPAAALGETVVPAPTDTGRLGRAAEWAGETMPKIGETGSKVLKVVGQVATVYGAVVEANKTYELEQQNNRGWLNAGLMWTGTLVTGVVAGVVDDALAGAVTTMTGSPAPVTESWDKYGSGPVQHFAGEAIRGILDLGAKHGL
jgi:hypothetical protein